MGVKPVVPRDRANRDIDDAITYYLKEPAADRAEDAAPSLVDALEDAYDLLGRPPAIGSFRYAHALGIPGLRSWSLSRFPYLVFYVEREDHIDVWRVLHGYRDIPALMQEPAE
jgi:toxin ParE1/3/4